ncbi:hypothetical protein FRACYDRAFT_237448 [Fragilariopsis cylindrus CCMP1102]|uniref:Replication factor-A protein 1 N-terminal domain-containing protein n=1 Tax=Fragilariopsis cylindrus CCMP1102 TaxID=635003 RepID=A0A1E7FLZ8_9STRA|nr:hypothetical protein FRACYDRAFT_237448 [Fragilariopsis cylindrus CCMP1102]|eukprot:OEU19157.1 hypothetical protein FRACYDRAFT_237448 [Fragilariopsis cylindrus CCMP1102]
MTLTNNGVSVLVYSNTIDEHSQISFSPPIATFEDSQLLLTSNAVSKLMKPTCDYTINIRPTCQVLNIKKFSMETGPDRYKLILSDGSHFVHAVLACKANWIASKLDPNDIVEIVQYNSVTTSTDNIIFIQDLVIKQSNLAIVGNPSLLVPTEEIKLDAYDDLSVEQTSPTPTATYIHQEHTIIDDWIILTNGSLHGIVREDNIPDGQGSSTITTSTVASFCFPSSLTINYESDFDSINVLNCVVTITGSCYQLGFKNVSCYWEEHFKHHKNNLAELSYSPEKFRTKIVTVHDYASHVFMGTFVDEEWHNGKHEMLVELDIDLECGSGVVRGDCVVGLDSLAYTQSRSLYRFLYPETVSQREGPHVTGDRVALIMFGQLTEKGITEDREEYYRISFDDYFSYPIEAQFPTEVVSFMVDLFSKLQHVTGVRRSESIGHLAECFPPIAIGHMAEPALLKRPLVQNTTTTTIDQSQQECIPKNKKVKGTIV